MLKILCGQQKGGVGKSTLTGNLAVGLSKRGKRVIIIDTDKQQTCVKWGSRRKLTNIEPEIAYATLMSKKADTTEFINTFDGMSQSNNFDYCLIDAGGRDNRELRLSLYVADVLIAPCLPSQPDVESLAEFDELIGEVMAGNPKLRCLTVINKANTGLNFSKEIELARSAIGELEFLPKPIATVTERPNFRSSWLEGKSAFDLTTESARKAQVEIERIIDQL